LYTGNWEKTARLYVKSEACLQCLDAIYSVNR
jgi:hypothetical protein